MARKRVEFEGTNDGEYMFHVYGANGEHQLQSEGYTRKHDAKRGLDDAFLSMIAYYKEEGRLAAMLEQADAVPDVAPKNKAYAEALGDNSGVWTTNADGEDVFATWNEVMDFVGSRPPSRPPKVSPA